MTKDIQVNEDIITCTYESTNIRETVYHLESQHLEVVFARGNRVTYHPVDLHTHQRLMLSESIGKEFSTKIQKNGNLKFCVGGKESFITDVTVQKKDS